MAAELLCCLGRTAALCLCLVHAEVEQMHPGDFACSQLCSLFLELCCPFLKKKLILQELAMLAFKIYIPCNWVGFSSWSVLCQGLSCWFPWTFMGAPVPDLISLVCFWCMEHVEEKKKPTKKVHFSPLDIFNVIVVKRQRLYRNLSIH